MNRENFKVEHMQFLIALINGSRLSPHIINGILQNLDLNITNFNDMSHYMSHKYPSIAKPTPQDWALAEEVLAKHERYQIHSISILDSKYPPYLRLIKNPPPAIFVRGNLVALHNLNAVAIVGTRKVTENGEKIAHRISSYMASHGWVVVSGLAIGVDAAVHKGALDAKGTTFAVLAHGLHKASPKQNSILADEILLNGGLWISEHTWGTEPKKEYFVLRNRIQSGLSCGSIIVESEIKSGTATQAEFCVNSKRALFAVVPQTSDNPLSLLSEGPLNMVAEKNAFPVKSKEDYPLIINQLNKVREQLNQQTQSVNSFF